MFFPSNILEKWYFWCAVHIIYWGKNKVMEVVKVSVNFLRGNSSLLLWLPTLQLISCPWRAQTFPCKTLPHGGCCKWMWCWSPPQLFQVWPSSPIPATGPTGPHCLCMREWLEAVILQYLSGKKWTKIQSYFFFFNKDGIKATSW